MLCACKKCCQPGGLPVIYLSSACQIHKKSKYPVLEQTKQQWRTAKTKAKRQTYDNPKFTPYSGNYVL